MKIIPLFLILGCVAFGCQKKQAEPVEEVTEVEEVEVEVPPHAQPHDVPGLDMPTDPDVTQPN